MPYLDKLLPDSRDRTSVGIITTTMSFWDQYLAPGDIRKGRAALEAQHDKAEEQAVKAAEQERPPRLSPAARSRRQNGLFFGGIAFAALAVLVSRRAVSRKLLSAGKLTAAGNNDAKVAGGLDAAEALGLATLNVVGFGMAAAGAIAKIFDVADIEDLRAGVRRGVGFDVYGGNEKADKELEEWVAEVLSRKDGGGLKDGLASRLAELEKLAKDKQWEQTKK